MMIVIIAGILGTVVGCTVGIGIDLGIFYWRTRKWFTDE